MHQPPFSALYSPANKDWYGKNNFPRTEELRGCRVKETRRSFHVGVIMCRSLHIVADGLREETAGGEGCLANLWQLWVGQLAVGTKCGMA
ncbi:MAG TPA: hypothetical protein VKK79_21995 [Candidatus Lokiarchaeia archaeon]|nr:hypothetical protein [Candidatus Lokiarchaeia archaeon]